MKVSTLNNETGPSIYITHSDEFKVGLNHQDHLIVFDHNQVVDLGAQNQRQIDNLCEYLQRLKIHLPA